ncbi:arylsulfatase [Algoriphagus pacificus]|uniref:Arylsulfatase n=1 Tax=Algoriphagus pacificus TaxID=2811234 RepID=A0ABS3CIR1_9BACT|nr:arylsulfatase [Algoriphagus pacificus]MBN7816988.1 arylsulfatase [Algoriphagus pacificus]
MKTTLVLILFLVFGFGVTIAQEILPFKPTPTASIAGRTIDESIYRNRNNISHLPENAPNILIILLDDTGPGLPDTYGGEVHTPTFTKLSQEGISYNRFHSTAMCSPTRAALLTGRNHTRIGNGQITELANDWDGFSGLIPKTSATVAEVLKNYGYSTAAFGKWHNTPGGQTTQAGPFDYWPVGYGFEYFYGFLAGETSQYEPTLIKNTTYVHPPKSPEEGYSLSEDLADNAIEWIRTHQAIYPEKPFLIYWAPGASHGPHQVPKKWSDKYKGKFDDGWDAYRYRVFERQKETGWIPDNTELTPRPEGLDAWSDIPENEKPFQRKLMEVFAGFTEQADYEAGRIIEELESLEIRENTLIFYIWGDNGSSSEGIKGSISEALTQNQIPSTVADHIRTANELGGLEILGTPKTDNMYHAGWAWAGSTPFKGTKLLGAYFGGTRQPLVVSWPEKIKPDNQIRTQFHHVNDVVPTIYDVLKIQHPLMVNGFQQIPFDGTSMAYSFNDADSPGQKHTQFFDIMGSRGIYHDGWFAATFGPRVPWMTITPGLAEWTPDKDNWELYNLEEDFSQANDLAQSYPEKLRAMKEQFLVESAKNNNLPIGGGLYLALHPDSLASNPATEFNYPGNFTRLPEIAAPKLGTIPNRITIDVDVPQKANGVLLALGGFSGGLSCYVVDGILHYEYNMMEIQRTIIKGKTKLPTGDNKIVIELGTERRDDYAFLNTGKVEIEVNGKPYSSGVVPTLVNLSFTFNECLDIGTDLGSPISDVYYDKAPFSFNGQIKSVNVHYTKQ